LTLAPIPSNLSAPMSASLPALRQRARATFAPAAHPPIDGLEVRRLEPMRDPRGSLTEIFSSAWSRQIAPEQWSLVQSNPGVLRGMHLHRRHAEYFLLVAGKAWVGLRDIRPGSPSENRSCLLELSAQEPTAVSFPRGIVHGWCFSEPSLHVQAVTEPYESYGPDDNLGCHWSDPELDIKWPFRPTEVSARAHRFPSLRMLIDRTLQIDRDFRY
jgi:dTDP-4-dehydrorhamnose 3,5-epimerase